MYALDLVEVAASFLSLSDSPAIRTLASVLWMTLVAAEYALALVVLDRLTRAVQEISVADVFA